MMFRRRNYKVGPDSVNIPDKTSTEDANETSKIQRRHMKRWVLKLALLVMLAVTGLLMLHSLTFPQMISVEKGFRASFNKKEEDYYKYEDEYTSALSTLGCFITPNCFPNKRCQVGEPAKIKRKILAEERSFCAKDLLSHSGNSKCLVYSFGIFKTWQWEKKMAQLFGCEVHAFDPTMDHPTDLAPGVTFHKIGLQGIGTDMSKTHAREYEAIDPNLLLSLSDIMKRLGHDDDDSEDNNERKIDILMMDCEGCEWGVLHELACPLDGGKPSYIGRVRQIVTEFHFQKELGLQTEADVMHAAKAVRCLWRDRWHIVSMELSGAGPQNMDYVRGISSILHTKLMLLMMTLERVEETDVLPAELLLTHNKRFIRTTRPTIKFDSWSWIVE